MIQLSDEHSKLQVAEPLGTEFHPLAFFVRQSQRVGNAILPFLTQQTNNCTGFEYVVNVGYIMCLHINGPPTCNFGDTTFYKDNNTCLHDGWKET